MFLVLPELYREAAERLCGAIGNQSYFSGTILFSFDGTECRMTTSVIVYREKILLPDGDTEVIANLVPVWWEFHTSICGEEVSNDFSFSEMKSLL